MDEFRPKPWLTPAQQVQHLESEGIKFELTSKDAAERYLKANNNFFRINLFRKGFPKYAGGLNDGLFIDLDFGMLRDLAIIDYEFRQVLLSISIDVEHFSKLQLLRYLEAHREDGYSVVEKYIASNNRKLENGKTVNSVKSEIDRGCGRFLGPRLGVSKLPAVLHRAQPLEGLLDAPIPIVREVGLEPPHELLGRHALPVPVAEELVLEAPEEALAGRVVRAAALRGHAPDQAVLLADPNPLRPAVVATPVRVDRRAPARRPRRAGLEQARVREALVGVQPDRPGDGHPVEAVDDRAQVDLLAAREPELGDVGEPQPVGLVGVEIPVHEVLRRLGDLAGVGAVAPGAPLVVDDLEALLAHHAGHALLAGADALAAQARPDGAVPPAPRALAEDAHHAVAYVGVAVARRGDAGPPVLIGALRYPQETCDRAEGQGGRQPQSLAELALAPVRDRSRVPPFRF